MILRLKYGHYSHCIYFLALRKHDVCFLITVRPRSEIGTPFRFRDPFVPQVGLTYVRGCEIEGLLDVSGRVIEEGPEPRPILPGDSRTFRVFLDCNQYRLDMDQSANGKEVGIKRWILLLINMKHVT